MFGRLDAAQIGVFWTEAQSASYCRSKNNTRAAPDLPIGVAVQQGERCLTRH
jgi:hypothetical protein